jgi:hypothetical protein
VNQEVVPPTFMHAQLRIDSLLRDDKARFFAIDESGKTIMHSFLVILSRLLVKQQFVWGKAFHAKAVFPLVAVVYLVCCVSFLVGVSQMNQLQSRRQQQINNDMTGYNGQMASRPLLRNNNSITVMKRGELQFVHERPVVDRAAVYLAMPTVPRAEDVDYLLKSLQSLENAKFPLSHIYVFYNDNPDRQPHRRWNEGETLFSSKGVHFLWNNAPVPEPHPAAYNISLPLPKVKHANMMLDARYDTVSRKDWRRKECNDFRIIAQYMLHVVHESDDSTDVPSARDNAWIIFNQDDAQWMVEFYYVYEKLNAQSNDTTRFDISRQGLVSVAFRAKFLAEIDEKAKLWCDFVPVDWMVWSCEDDEHKTAKAPPQDNWVEHIGKVSTRKGVVSDQQ